MPTRIKRQDRTMDMTQGSPMKLILKFLLPIIAGGLFQQCYSLVDTLVVGRIEGVTALAAVSSSGWLDWTVLSVAMGMAQGCSIRVAQHFGAGDHQALKRAVGQSIFLSAITLVVLTILAYTVMCPILRLMNTPENTFPLTVQYLRIIFAGATLVLGFNLTAGFLRALGDSRTPLVAMVCSSLCNIVLDIVFVAVFGWGVRGVASATVVSQGVSFLICLAAVCRLPQMRPEKTDLKPDWTVLGQLTKLGLPIALQNVIISAGGMVLQGVANSFGFIFMAGFSAAGRLTGLIEMAGASIGTAMGTFAGQNMGAGRLDRVKKGLRSALVLSLSISTLLAITLILFGRQLVALFIDDDPAVMAQVIEVAYQYLIVMGLGLFTLYLLFAYRSTLQGLGDTFIPMMSGFMEMIMRIGTVLLLPMLLGEWGVYIAEVMAWAGAAALLMWGYYRRMRKLEKEYLKVTE